MSQAHFSLTYDGEAVRDGELDATDLASAILALAQTVKATGKIVLGPEAEVTLKVRTHRTGSFEILMNAVAHGDVGIAWTIIKQFYKSEDAETAKAVVETLFMGKSLVAGSVVGLVAFLRWRRSRSVQKTERLEGGATKVTIDGDELVVAPSVLEASRDPTIRAGLRKVIAEPLERDGITSVRFSGEAESIIVLAKDRDSFRDDEALNADFSSVYDKAFSIVTLSFKAGNKWKLHDGQGARSVTILDEEFIKRIDAGAERFAKGDLLVCQVRETAVRTGGSFKSQYEIIKVIEHRPYKPPEQLQV